MIFQRRIILPETFLHSPFLHPFFTREEAGAIHYYGE